MLIGKLFKESGERMKKKIAIFMTAFMLLGFSSSSFATTTQVDALIEKLVDKGILTRSEGIKLKGEIAADADTLAKETMKKELPEWVQKMKLKGDFRLRYQYERKDGDADARERGRIRYRLGLETEIVKDVKVAAGLATGPNVNNTNGSTGSDPRSTNQSFTDTFEHPSIQLDYGYAEWQAYKTDNDLVKLIGGVHPRPDYLWNPTDLLWDSDINPQGGAFHAEHKFNDQLTAYVNGGVWVIDENTNTTTYDRADSYMDFGQGGIKFQKGKLSTNIAGIYYGFNALKQTCPDWSGATNTGITTVSNSACTAGSLRYDYDAVGGSAEIAYAKPFDFPFEEVAIFGDYIENVDGWSDGIDMVDQSIGWAIGARLGDKKVNGKKQWQLKYIYATLGKDAWPDFLPDSDRYGGKTDIKSHEGIIEIGLLKNVTFALDYYQSRRMKTTKAPEHVIQADINFKF